MNKVALVTGGGSGIGHAIAEMLLAEGYHVAIASRRIELLAQIVAQWESRYPGKSMAVACDVRDKAAVDAAYGTVQAHFGAVSVLINNSGVGAQESIVDCSQASWDEVQEVTLRGAFFMMQAVLPNMIKAQSGWIINIASQAAKNGYAGAGPYCAAKFGLLGLGLALQEEVRTHGIRVHSVCPGLVQVPPPQHADDRKPGWLQVEDLAQTVKFVLNTPSHVHLENIGMWGVR